MLLAGISDACNKSCLSFSCAARLQRGAQLALLLRQRLVEQEGILLAEALVDKSAAQAVKARVAPRAAQRAAAAQLRAQDKSVCLCRRNTVAYLFGTCSTSRKRGTGRFEDASDGLFLLSRLKSRFVCAPGRPAGGGLPGLRRLRPVTVPS